MKALKVTAEKIKQRLLSLSSYGLIVGFTILISLINKTWSNPDGFPTGWDTYAHLTKIRYVLDFWPHSSWAHMWYIGTPIFRWYSPLPYYLTALFVKIAGWTIEFALTFTFLISIILVGVAIFLSVFEVTKDRLASLIAATLTLSSTILWNYGLWIGMYSRYLATAMFSFFIFFLLRYLKQTYTNYQSKGNYFGLVAFISLSALSHPVMGIVTALTLLVGALFCIEKWKRKINELIKISLPAALLSGYFYFPFLKGIPELVISGVAITQERESFTLFDIGCFLMGVRHKYPASGMAGELSLLTIPLIFLAVLFILVRHGSWNNAIRKLSLRMVLSFGFLSVFLVIYMILAGRVGWIFFSIFFLPLVCGILVHYATAFKRVKFGKMSKVLMLCGILLSVFFIVYPINSFSLKVHERSVQNNLAFDVVQRLLTNESSGNIANYRFGVPSDPVAWWFNYEHPNVPQTRGYFGGACLHMDWFVWFESTVWGSVEGINPALLPEINFLFDWYAIRWFVIYPPYNYTKYLEAQNFYEKVAVGGDGSHGFLYRGATPIVSATNVPSMLVVGKRQYRSIMGILSYSDFDSRHIIPVHGNDYIDDYSLDELKEFDVILLYGYQHHNRERAWTLLEEYVQGGGALIIETGLQYVNPDWNSTSIPLPCPVNKTAWKNFGMEWAFSYATSYITDGINFSAFSPAVSHGDPWNFASTTNGSVRNWAQPLLWDSGQPAVVVGEYGKGRVIWSGLNLPWHILVYKNSEESRFFIRMIEWVWKAPEREVLGVDHRVERLNPEKIVVTINNASTGVLFKENYFENWHVYIENKNRRQRLEVLKVGPEFMYVRLPKNLLYPIEVTFKYELSPLKLGSIATSVATFCILVAYGILGEKLTASFAHAAGKIKKKIEDWWYKE